MRRVWVEVAQAAAKAGCCEVAQRLLFFAKPLYFPSLLADTSIEWYDNPAVSAQDAVKILVHQIQQNGPISASLQPVACACRVGAPDRAGAVHYQLPFLPQPSLLLRKILDDALLPSCRGHPRSRRPTLAATRAGQRHLQQLYRRCQTPDDLDKALKLTRLNYLARGELQQHKPFSHRTSQILIHVRPPAGCPHGLQGCVDAW